jgi:hypothetical protein
MNYFRPHTAEWFEALRSFDPTQAEMTKQIVELAGSVDVCSVCGDKPATDYKVIGRPFDPSTGATMRLCDDCREIQRSIHGESYIKF